MFKYRFVDIEDDFVNRADPQENAARGVIVWPPAPQIGSITFLACPMLEVDEAIDNSASPTCFEVNFVEGKTYKCPFAEDLTTFQNKPVVKCVFNKGVDTYLDKIECTPVLVK